MSPLRQIVQEGGALAIQPDTPIRSTPQTPAGMLLALAAALIFGIALAHHYARWPFHQRPARPFSRAHRALRRHASHQGNTSAAMIILHRAFDAAAGQCLLAGDVAAFVATRPQLAACQSQIEHFFAASRGAFFGDTGGLMSLPELRELAQALAHYERQNEAAA